MSGKRGGNNWDQMRHPAEREGLTESPHRFPRICQYLGDLYLGAYKNEIASPCIVHLDEGNRQYYTFTLPDDPGSDQGEHHPH